MELIVGTNAYADVNEYNELISTGFISRNNIRVFWESLNDDDKKSLVIGSTLKYDNDTMLYKGNKQYKNQPLQFPRIVRCGDIINCPDSIKIGILLQGCRDSMIDGTTEGEMIMNGVKSFADGTGARIEFMDNSNSSGYSSKNSNGIYKDIWIRYFAQHSLIV